MGPHLVKSIGYLACILAHADAENFTSVSTFISPSLLLSQSFEFQPSLDIVPVSVTLKQILDFYPVICKYLPDCLSLVNCKIKNNANHVSFKCPTCDNEILLRRKSAGFVFLDGIVKQVLQILSSNSVYSFMFLSYL